MEGDDRHFDELQREMQQLKTQFGEVSEQLRAMKVMLEDAGYKVNAKREH